jgi:hypothetical protein
MKNRIILPANRTDANKATNFIGNLPRDKPWLIEVSPYSPKRSQDQNNYLFGVVYRTLQEQLFDDLGWDKDDVHDFFCGLVFGTKQTELDGRTYDRPVSGTSGLNKQEFSDYLMAVGKWAAEHGIYIPDPNEGQYE